MNSTGGGNEYPIHDQFSDISTGDSYNDFSHDADNSSEAFYNFADISTGDSYNDFQGSGFQFLTGLTLLVEIDDGSLLTDSPVMSVLLTTSESLIGPDSVQLNESFMVDEDIFGDDTVLPTMTLVIDELQLLTESVFIPLPITNVDELLGPDSVLIDATISTEDDLMGDDEGVSGYSYMSDEDILGDDSFTTHYDIFIDENQLLTDQVFIQTPNDIFVDESLMSESVSISYVTSLSFGTELQIAKQSNASYGTELQLMTYNPPGITSVALPTNPLKPTVKRNGIILVSNPETVKASVGDYISLQEAQYFGGRCDVLSASINMSLGGIGTWSMESTQESAGLGAQQTIMGLTGIITRKGERSGPGSGRVFLTKGVFGDIRMLNKQILLTVDTQFLSTIDGIWPTPIQSGAPPDKSTTVSDACRSLANLGNIGLQWATADAPLYDSFLESGQTVGDAIRTLAARVGGIVVWISGDSYVVIDPAQGYGVWEGILDCSYVLPPGLEYENILDSAGAIVTKPVEPLNATTADIFKLIPVLQSPPPQPVIGITAYRNKFKGTSPVYLPLAGDFESAWQQLLLDADHPAVAGGQYPPYDSSQWNTYPGTTVVGNAKEGLKRLTVDSDSFDPSLQDGKFTLHIGYRRAVEAMEDAYLQQLNVDLQKKKLLQQAEIEKMRFFEVQESSVPWTFHGSIPMVGMRTTVTYDGITASGLVKSLTGSFAQRKGWEMNASIGDFRRMDLITPRVMLDWYAATGTPAPP